MTSNREPSAFEISLAVGLLVFALGGGTAHAAMATVSSGSGLHAGTVPSHGAPTSRPLVGRPADHRPDRPHDRRRFLPYVAGVPYDDWYWDDGGYGYDAS